LGIGDWGLGIGDWGLGPIPNPQSPIPNFIILLLSNFNNTQSTIHNIITYYNILLNSKITIITIKHL